MLLKQVLSCIEFLDPRELAIVGPVAVEPRAINDLYCPLSANNVSRPPHLAIATGADLLDQFVIRDANSPSARRLRNRSLA